MNIGNRIKRIRLINNFDRKQLAGGKGISLSHISNIENNVSKPSESLLQILSQRLKVSTEYLLNYDSYNSQLADILYSVKTNLDNNDTKLASTKLSLIADKYPLIESVVQETYYFLLKTMVSIKENKVESAIDTFINDITPMLDHIEIDSLSAEFQETYFYIEGILNYHNKKYLESYQFFTKQLPLINNSFILAGVYFNLALSLYQLNNIKDAITFAIKSIDIYHSEKTWAKMVDVDNLLGVLYTKLDNYDKAIDHYITALQIINSTNLKHESKAIILHNLGELYKKKSQFRKSLNYLFESLELKQRTNGNTQITYRTILEIYLSQKNIPLVESTLNIAIANCDNEIDEVHLEAIQAKLNLIKGNVQLYEVTMKKAIDYLFVRELWKYLEGLLEEMANFYIERKKYKYATDYLEKYNIVLIKLYKEGVKQLQ